MRLILIVLALMAAGCQSVPKQTAPGRESPKEIVSAISSVTQGLTNQPLSEEDLRRLAVQVQKDPQAKSALQAVNTSFDVRDTGVKYCPIDGKRFNSRVEYCPDHKVKLIPVE